MNGFLKVLAIINGLLILIVICFLAYKSIPIDPYGFE